MLSPRAIEFVKQWTEENVAAGPRVGNHREDHRPAEYSEACLAAAEEEGIHLAEIEESVGNLHTYMAGAIDAAADNEVARR
jgi:hypothetical protein